MTGRRAVAALAALALVGGCAAPLRHHRRLTAAVAIAAMVTVVVGVPLTTGCTPGPGCDLRSDLRVFGLAALGGGVVGALVALELGRGEHAAPPERPPVRAPSAAAGARPAPRPAASSAPPADDDEPAAGSPVQVTFSADRRLLPADEGSRWGATARGPSVNAACAQAKRDLFESLLAECDRAGDVGVAAHTEGETGCTCAAGVDGGAVCATFSEVTCTDVAEDTVSVGAWAAPTRGGAGARAIGNARGICGRHGMHGTYAPPVCRCDDTDCVCVVVATCDP